MDKELYKSLIALLNELRGNSENIVFYKQDAIPVRGSLVKQTPDIGAVFKELVESRDLLALPHASDEKIFWGLIHTFVEVKHEDGKMIRDDCELLHSKLDCFSYVDIPFSRCRCKLEYQQREKPSGFRERTKASTRCR
ncbi:hypothetical protein C8R41DRAFT_809246 [Lentinula lateritia]|uniref:Fungal-type protein kinase domain-containing protein n=1 Tax=Lentinula lateritia TaxID=40482 RepID=A0ABQ8VWV2_9AGAR|nr:hypothetical protein C8R41DRAFT_809246 [Lentinula lateritia]